jgi:hypothetical protein
MNRKNFRSHETSWANEYVNQHGMTPGINESYEPGEFDTKVAVDGLIGAYAGLAEGISTDVEKAGVGVPMPKLREKVIYYVNGEPGATSTYLSVKGEEPSYSVQYRDLRKRAMEGLLFNAAASKDLSLVLSTIHTLQDPVPATMLLTEIFRKPERFTGMATRELIVKAERKMAVRNRRSEGLNLALERYAMKKRLLELRSTESGVLGSLATMLALKTNFGLKKYTERVILDPVEEIAYKPRIEVQLLDAAIKKSKTNDRLRAGGYSDV